MRPHKQPFHQLEKLTGHLATPCLPVLILLFSRCSVHFVGRDNCRALHSLTVNKVIQYKEKISHRQLGPLRGSSSPFSRRGLNPIKPVYDPDRPDGRPEGSHPSHH